MSLAAVAKATGATLHRITDPDTQVTGPLSFDSRSIAPGGLFACLRGRSLDGHDFAAQAVADGAVAVLADHGVDAPALLVTDVLEAMRRLAHALSIQYTGTVIALTGSAGKTSTKDILLNVLSLDGPTVANAKSFNNEIGFPVTVSRVESDSRYLVLEMGARGKGHIASLCNTVRPQIATVLGIGSAHIGEFGSKEAIADAKAEIIRSLPTNGTAVLNFDDPLVAAMADQTNAPILTFGTTSTCDVRAEEITATSDGHPAFLLRHGDQHALVTLSGIYGRHNVTNALAAAATSIAAGVAFDHVVQGLQTAALSSGGRMEVLQRPDGVTVINDAFNASPESVLAALDALADIAGTTRRRIAVLGEMAELGDDTRHWHDTVARKVVSIEVTHTIGVGNDHARHMVSAIRESGLHATDAGPVASLSDHVNTLLQPGDVVLVKGANTLGLERVAHELAAAATP